MDGEPKGPGPTSRPDPRLELAPGVLEDLAALARAAAPEEACGLLVGGASAGMSRVVEAPPVPNRAPDPRLGFELDPVDWARLEGAARERGLEVLGHWHSHPRGGARFSDEDRWFAMPGAWSLVVTPAGDWSARFVPPDRAGVTDPSGSSRP